MAYDLISPNGPKALGVVTDAERFAHQKLMDAQRMALADAAAKAGGGGGSGATEGNDPFFSDGGPFGTAPKQTGAVDLASRNAMVDMRQQATRQVEDAANIAKGYTPGYERELNQMKGEDAIKRERQQETLRDMLNTRTQGMFGGDAGAPGATSVPMPLPGRGGANALVGPDNSGSPAAPAGRGHMSEDDMLELQMLASLANGGAAPDVAGAMNKRSERDQSAQKFALDIEQKRLEMARARKEQSDADETRRLGRPVDMRLDDFLTRSPGMTQPLTDAVKKFAEKDTAMFGRDPSPRAMQAVLGERDNLANGLIQRGYSEAEARQQANLLIKRGVEPYASDLNSGQIQKLLQALDGGAPASAPAVLPLDPPAYDPSPSLVPLARKIGGLYPAGALGPPQ